VEFACIASVNYLPRRRNIALVITRPGISLFAMVMAIPTLT